MSTNRQSRLDELEQQYDECLKYSRGILGGQHCEDELDRLHNEIMSLKNDESDPCTCRDRIGGWDPDCPIDGETLMSDQH